MKLVISYDNVFHSRSKSVLFAFHIPSFSLIEEDISTHKCVCTWNIDSIDKTVHTIKPCFVLYRELELPSKMQNDITKNRYERFENRYRSLFFLHTRLVSLAISKSEVLSSIYWSCIEKHQRHISVTFVVLQLEIKSLWKETPLWSIYVSCLWQYSVFVMNVIDRDPTSRVQAMTVSIKARPQTFRVRVISMSKSTK